jgi:predicted MFS family arabinose efflux permease
VGPAPAAAGQSTSATSGFPRASALASAAVLAVCVGFPLAVSYAAPELRDVLSVSRGRLGLAVGLFYGVTGVASVAAGVATDRWGARAATAGSMLLVFLGLLVSALHTSFLALVGTSIVAGVGYALGNAGTSTALADVVTPAQRDLAFTIRTAGVPVMLIACSASVPALAHLLGWRAVLVGLMVITAAAGLVALRVGGAVSPTRRREVVRPPVGRLPSGFWWFPMASLLFLTGSNAVMTWPVLYLVEGLHLSAGVAGALVAVCLLVGTVVLLAVGRWGGSWLSRLGTSVLVLGTGLCAAGVVVLLLAPELGLVFTVVGLAAAVSGNLLVVTLVQSAVVRVASTAVGRATGVLLTGYYLGALVGPAVFGGLADTAGGYRLAWAGSLAALVLSGLAFVRCGRIVPTRAYAVGSGDSLDGAAT